MRQKEGLMNKKNIRRALMLTMCASMMAGCAAGSQDNGTAPAETIADSTADNQNEETSSATEESTEEPTEESTEPETTEEPLSFDASLADKSTSFTVDGGQVLTAENTRYDGLGMVTANNSSRLLLDYKAEHPEAYQKLLEYMFGEDGMGLSLIKIEMGADVDSSSGTEPAVKRTEDEKADVTRGAGYQLAADALSINPDIKVDMLYWGVPNWVKNADDPHEALYQWYKQTIDAMYDTYGIQVSYITANQNERSIDIDFIKYIRNALDNETDARYDYSAIQIVAGEEVGTWSLAKKMLEDEELMDAVDVITSHYTSWTNADVLTLQRDYGKKVWFSEGSSPMSYATSTYNYDGTGSGMSDINGMLDVATRITTAMANGMTMYEFQPVISAYYDGVTYYPKQLITANTPWSGGYSLDAGFYMTLHFDRFVKPGWMYVANARYGDGTAGGDGHAIVNSTYNYMTCVDENKENCSIVLVNNSADTIGYTISLKNLELADTRFHVWETRGPESGQDYYTNFFNRLGYVDSADGEIQVVMAPYSMMTLTTLDEEESAYESAASAALALPYEDDFEYADYDRDYLAGRGNAPRYTTDQGGAFEVASTADGNVLMQQITSSIKPSDWGSTSDPITNLGDDTWSNYTVSADVHFADEPEDDGKTNYLGIGARYNLADANYSGYWIKLSADGTVELKKDNSTLADAFIEGLDTSAWHSLSLTVTNTTIIAAVDDEELIRYEDNESPVISGRAALYSALQKNYFDNLKVTEAEGYASTITRVDNFDAELTYSEGSNEDTGAGWYHNTMCSFKNYHRTVSTGYEGATLEFSFEGQMFALIGAAKNAELTIEIDGVVVESAYAINASQNRKAVYANYGLDEGVHTVKITVNAGSLDVDVVEYQ